MPLNDDGRWVELRKLWPVVHRWLTVLGEVLDGGARQLPTTGQECRTDSVEGPRSARDGGWLIAPPSSGAVPSPPGLPIEEFDPESCRRQHRRAIFEQLLDDRILFSDDQWVALEAYHHFGLSPAEIAERLGVTPKAVYDRLERAMKRFADHKAKLRRERASFVRNHSEL